ncbi:MAG: hypothetical protein GY950_07310 [bacterium]|nr:hypothetical protein [bacterium]
MPIVVDRSRISLVCTVVDNDGCRWAGSYDGGLYLIEENRLTLWEDQVLKDIGIISLMELSTCLSPLLFTWQSL